MVLNQKICSPVDSEGLKVFVQMYLCRRNFARLGSALHEGILDHVLCHWAMLWARVNVATKLPLICPFYNEPLASEL